MVNIVNIVNMANMVNMVTCAADKMSAPPAPPAAISMVAEARGMHRARATMWGCICRREMVQRVAQGWRFWEIGLLLLCKPTLGLYEDGGAGRLETKCVFPVLNTQPSNICSFRNYTNTQYCFKYPGLVFALFYSALWQVSTILYPQVSTILYLSIARFICPLLARLCS